MDKPGPVAFENGQALIFFPRTSGYKISYQDFNSKQTLILVSLLSFKNSNPQSKKKCWVDHWPNQM